MSQGVGWYTSILARTLKLASNVPNIGVAAPRTAVRTKPLTGSTQAEVVGWVDNLVTFSCGVDQTCWALSLCLSLFLSFSLSLSRLRGLPVRINKIWRA